jgi:hypothetical protein
VAALRKETDMTIYFIIFGLLAGLAGILTSVRISREIDRMEEAEWVTVEDHHKREMCREAILDDVCGYKCGECPWCVEEETDGERDAEGGVPYSEGSEAEP